MCRIDDAERVTILTDAFRKARKPHKCGECGRAIPKGEIYRYEAGTCEGCFGEYKTCQHCLIAREWLLKNCGGYIYEQVGEEIREHAEEYRHLARPLLRICIAMGRKWRRFSRDELMPVPNMPPPIQQRAA